MEGRKDRTTLKGRGEGWTRVSSCRGNFKGDGVDKEPEEGKEKKLEENNCESAHQKYEKYMMIMTNIHKKGSRGET